MENIGKYKIIKQLGAGGFGQVYLAHDAHINRDVAIKVFHPKDENLIAFATSSDTEGLDILRQRFANEARILGSLEDNPYVINILEFGELPDGSPYYIMPFMAHSLTEKLGKDVFDASTVAELTDDQKPRAMPFDEALAVFAQILTGIAGAHEKGLVHRDIKPSNIMLSAGGDVRIVDFGIAKAPDSGHSTVSQLGMGSRNYMAPEQRESAKHVDARADVYSLGTLGYRMFTGRLPTGRYADPNVLVPSISQALNDVLIKAISEHKDGRYSDAVAFNAAFNRALSEQGSITGAETTATWVGGSDGIAAELLPLEQKIIHYLNENGEVKDNDKAVLQALADLVDLPADGLDELIARVAKQQANNSPQQKAFQRWVDNLNRKRATGETLSAEQVDALLVAGVASTGKQKSDLQSIVEQKGLCTSAVKANTTAETETTTVKQSPAPTEKPAKTSAKWPAVVVLFAVVLGGAYWVSTSSTTQNKMGQGELSLSNNAGEQTLRLNAGDDNAEPDAEETEKEQRVTPKTDFEKELYSAGVVTGNYVNEKSSKQELPEDEIRKGFEAGIANKPAIDASDAAALLKAAEGKEAFEIADRKQVAYAMGQSIGLYFHKVFDDFNKWEGQDKTDLVISGYSMVIGGFFDGLRASPVLSEDDVNAYSNKLNERVKAGKKQYEENIASRNIEIGKQFLAENAKKPGVITTASGLQYEVIRAGTGASPDADDTVTVHYSGTLIDGTEFDSSYARNERISFPLNKVIEGWTEGLQLMKEGAKYRLFIPANLAYGERATGAITANSTLIFEVELFKVEKN